MRWISCAECGDGGGDRYGYGLGDVYGFGDGDGARRDAETLAFMPASSRATRASRLAKAVAVVAVDGFWGRCLIENRTVVVSQGELRTGEPVRSGVGGRRGRVRPDVRSVWGRERILELG